VTNFDIHARIAVIRRQNFSPKNNRKVPPLRYNHVYRLAEEFPELNISLNGGIETLSGVKSQLEECPSLSGVMVGRAWCANPWSFVCADEVLYGTDNQSPRPKNRMEVLQKFGQHADYEEATYDPVKIRRFITKSVEHLFAGEPNAKRYRIALDKIAGLPKKLFKERQLNPNIEQLPQQPPLSELILDAASHLSEEVLYRTPEESYAKIIWEEENKKKKEESTFSPLS